MKDKINAFEKNQANENTSPNTPPSSAISVSNLRSSFVSNETPSVLSNRLLRQSSLISAQNSEINKEKNRSFGSIYKLSNEADSNGKHPTVDESNTNIASETTNEKDSDDSRNFTLNKVPKSELEISPNRTKNLNVDKNIFSFKTGDESPKVSRDIFKTSLQPLKLSLPSSIRKEQSNSPRTSSESEKVLDIPQIKSNYSVTLPRTHISRNLSLHKDPVKFKSSNSESNINCEDESYKSGKLIRRSSLESSNETSSDKQVTDLTSLKASSKLFNRAISAQEISFSDGSDPKSPLKSYTPIYKSILSSSSLPSKCLLQSNDELSECPTTSDVERKGFQKEASKREHPQSIPTILNRALSTAEEEKDNLKVLPHSFKNSSSEICVQESKVEYPDDLNPFGDEEEDNNEKKEEEYPDDLNPFGDGEQEVKTTKIVTDDYDESKNPFASDDEESDIQVGTSPSIYSPKPSFIENKTPNFPDSISSNLSSPSGSLKGTLKKRQAPKPPTVQEIFKDSGGSALDTSTTAVKSSPSATKKTFQTSSPKIRKNKPAPPPPTPPVQDAANIKMSKETDNLRLKSSMQNTEEKPLPPKQFKKKKRPAPPVPIPMRQNVSFYYYYFKVHKPKIFC